jgi:hypothetical protein
MVLHIQEPNMNSVAKCTTTQNNSYPMTYEILHSASALRGGAFSKSGEERKPALISW